MCPNEELSDKKTTLEEENIEISVDEDLAEEIKKREEEYLQKIS